ncbi:hypothetical protein [Duganella levis]|uniref:DUF2511 domain-containing protein n=1 Tax=Duganella levis TaxID=2692169 RepID=A0ABW9W4G2_9BURK|nr:hypothetical protein [Duganella levis]MYN28914.1 hypothetical protein [Duganella levis]
MKALLGILAVASVSLTAGFAIGKNKGVHEGYVSASAEYDNWSTGMMYRDPNTRLDAILLAPNGARVQVPKCDDDEELNAIAWSRPTSGTSIDAKLMRDGGSLTLSMSGEGSENARAAVVLGCRKKILSQNVLDLTKSWELPATLR